MILFIEDLDELRERIKGIDYSIMSLISRRIELAKEVGKLKTDKGLPIRNFQVEKQVYERINRYSDEFKLDDKYMTSIYENIIEASVSAQIPIHRVQGKSFGSILIIGGSGKMGSWFADFFVTSGYQVEIADPNPHSELHTHQNIPDQLDNYDIIAVCSPLLGMEKVLEKVIMKNPRGVVFDIASLKSHLLHIPKLAENKNVKYVSIHPMFGPDVKHLVGRNLIICNTKNRSAKKTIEDIFSETSADVVSVDIEEHDRYMIYSLGLPHFVNLMVGKVLEKSNLQYTEIEQHAGTTMIKQLEATKELFTENPELYHSIQFLNNYKTQLYQEIKDSIEDLIGFSTKDDPTEFSQFMVQTRKYMEGQNQ